MYQILLHMKTFLSIFKGLRRIDWAIVCIVLISYSPLVYGVVTDNHSGQSFATWALWTTLDIITLSIAIKERKSYMVILTVFTMLGFVMTTILFAKHMISWGTKETIVCGAVIVSFAGWYYFQLLKKDSWSATITATATEITAGIPLLIEIWKNDSPQTTTLLSFSGLFIANCLSIYGAKAWTVQDRLFSTSFALYNIFIIVPLVIRHLG